MTTLWRWRTADRISIDAFGSSADAITGCIEDLDLWHYEPNEPSPECRRWQEEAIADGTAVVCDDDAGTLSRVHADGTRTLFAWVVPSGLGCPDVGLA
ncbi:MAG: hypothetical protein IPG04_16795 [Polyangiaceae bacterium]|nr:hypothetical protein [Polyangiaceae bacterium]